MNLAIPVLVLPGALPDTVGVETHIQGNPIRHILVVNLTIQPIDLLSLIDIIGAGWGAIVWIPSKLWGVHECGYSHSIGALRVMAEASQLHHVSKPFELVHDVLPAVPFDEVVVPSNYHHVQRLLVRLLTVVQPESVSKGLYGGTWYGHIVTVQDVSRVADWGWDRAVRSVCGEKLAAEKLVQCAVRHSHLDPVPGVGLVVGLAGGAEVVTGSVLHTSKHSHPEAGEVPVVHWDLWARVFLSVGANIALITLPGSSTLDMAVSSTSRGLVGNTTHTGASISVGG